MHISEETLKELVLRIMQKLQAENRKKLYMVCTSAWDERYPEFLKQMAGSACDIYPVIPQPWQQSYERILREHGAVSGVWYWEKGPPADLETAVTVFPVVNRTLIAKAALCISDTFETSWIADGIGAGSRIVLLYSGMEKFTGKENPAYVERVMTYYRQVLEYGIEFGGVSDLPGGPVSEPDDNISPMALTANPGKKRVITAANVDSLATGGVLYLQADDIITDLARDRAKSLNIILK